MEEVFSGHPEDLHTGHHYHVDGGIAAGHVHHENYTIPPTKEELLEKLDELDKRLDKTKQDLITLIRVVSKMQWGLGVQLSSRGRSFILNTLNRLIREYPESKEKEGEYGQPDSKTT